MKPVRKIGMTVRSLRAIQPSEKNGRTVHLESALERDFCCLVEFDKNVAEYVEQPVIIRYLEDGQVRRYTPDFLVSYSNGKPSQLVEIKYAEDLRINQAQFAARFLAADRHARAEGWEFCIWTETEIRTTYLKNVKFLLRFRSIAIIIRTEYEQLIFGLVAQLGKTTPAEVLAIASQDPSRQAELLPVLWHLIGDGRVGCDLSENLAMRSSIWNTSHPSLTTNG
jgi:hypothetical protein